jgi:hypothetical protein
MLGRSPSGLGWASAWGAVVQERQSRDFRDGSDVLCPEEPRQSCDVQSLFYEEGVWEDDTAFCVGRERERERVFLHDIPSQGVARKHRL